MEALQQSLTRVAMDPAYHDLFTVLKACRNGIVYGIKIRFPHALVMTFLFGRGTTMEKLRFIMTATRQHAWNLGRFAPLYKFLRILMRRLRGGKSGHYDSFFAGLLAGYTVFGERTAVNEQIVLYMSSRVIASFLPRSKVPDNYPPTKPIPTDSKAFATYATIAWGMVMYLHEHRRQTIQSGMVSSMDYLYTRAEKWDGLRNLFWHNQ
ncbi:peroxisomal membrane protein 4 [Violaceomyces palustris]|uniref:Peroxisomal membrane protein 4 n=1 Tax=Violaceomyces palustris TaxID=1673888 RepID=A0ACD0P3A8_9BASI|nr:peroxisomal membrane protein 4 [Violaceomyces palustris]